MRKAVPTAEARDFRKITHADSYGIHGNGYLSVSGNDTPTDLKSIVAEVVRCRDADAAHIVCYGALISGKPDAVLPILNALLTHADETDHLEEQQ